MKNRVLLVLLTVVIAGGFYGLFAQQQSQTQPQHLQTAKDLPKRITVDPGYKGPPFFTFKGTYYGFVSDNKDRRLGNNATPDQIRKSVAAGAHYTLGGTEVTPAEKAAPFAGQWVTAIALFRSNTYGSGATSEPSIDGFPAGDGTVSTRTRSIEIVSIKADSPPNDEGGGMRGGAGITADSVGAGYGVQSPAQ